MAGHAPEFLTSGRRLHRWVVDLSDLRLSLYMLLASAVIGAVLYAFHKTVVN
jgi:hypothetical protein